MNTKKIIVSACSVAILIALAGGEIYLFNQDTKFSSLFASNSSSTFSLEEKMSSSIATQQQYNTQLANLHQQALSAASTLSNIQKPLPQSFIDKIQPLVAYVYCKDENGNYSAGSGFMLDSKTVWSNAHVPYGSNLSGSVVCYAVPTNPPNYSIKVNSSIGYSLELSSGQVIENGARDLALFQASLPSTVTANGRDVIGACATSSIADGDEVTIIGYPQSGSLFQVTQEVTTGFISALTGTDSSHPIYEVTGGIDHGNSGGIAILNKDQCNIGIPTWGDSGLTGGTGYIQYIAPNFQ
jgi:hypothetical protein